MEMRNIAICMVLAVASAAFFPVTQSGAPSSRSRTTGRSNAWDTKLPSVSSRTVSDMSFSSQSQEPGVAFNPVRITNPRAHGAGPPNNHRRISRLARLRARALRNVADITPATGQTCREFSISENSNSDYYSQFRLHVKEPTYLALRLVRAKLDPSYSPSLDVNLFSGPTAVASGDPLSEILESFNSAVNQTARRLLPPGTFFFAIETAVATFRVCLYSVSNPIQKCTAAATVRLSRGGACQKLKPETQLDTWGAVEGPSRLFRVVLDQDSQVVLASPTESYGQQHTLRVFDKCPLLTGVVSRTLGNMAQWQLRNYSNPVVDWAFPAALGEFFLSVPKNAGTVTACARVFRSCASLPSVPLGRTQPTAVNVTFWETEDVEGVNTIPDNGGRYCPQGCVTLHWRHKVFRIVVPERSLLTIMYGDSEDYNPWTWPWVDDSTLVPVTGDPSLITLLAAPCFYNMSARPLAVPGSTTASSVLLKAGSYVVIVSGYLVSFGFYGSMFGTDEPVTLLRRFWLVPAPLNMCDTAVPLRMGTPTPLTFAGSNAKRLLKVVVSTRARMELVVADKEALVQVFRECPDTTVGLPLESIRTNSYVGMTDSGTYFVAVGRPALKGGNAPNTTISLRITTVDALCRAATALTAPAREPLYRDLRGSGFVDLYRLTVTVPSTLYLFDTWLQGGGFEYGVSESCESLLTEEAASNTMSPSAYSVPRGTHFIAVRWRSADPAAARAHLYVYPVAQTGNCDNVTVIRAPFDGVVPLPNCSRQHEAVVVRVNASVASMLTLTFQGTSWSRMQAYIGCSSPPDGEWHSASHGTVTQRVESDWMRITVMGCSVAAPRLRITAQQVELQISPGPRLYRAWNVTQWLLLLLLRPSGGPEWELDQVRGPESALYHADLIDATGARVATSGRATAMLYDEETVYHTFKLPRSVKAGPYTLRAFAITGEQVGSLAVQVHDLNVKVQVGKTAATTAVTYVCKVTGLPADSEGFMTTFCGTTASAGSTCIDQTCTPTRCPTTEYRIQASTPHGTYKCALQVTLPWQLNKPITVAESATVTI